MSFIEIAKYVGNYQIGGPHGLKINLQHKPCWLHRKMAQWFFGFVWIDEANK